MKKLADTLKTYLVAGAGLLATSCVPANVGVANTINGEQRQGAVTRHFLPDGSEELTTRGTINSGLLGLWEVVDAEIRCVREVARDDWRCVINNGAQNPQLIPADWLEK